MCALLFLTNIFFNIYSTIQLQNLPINFGLFLLLHFCIGHMLRWKKMRKTSEAWYGNIMVISNILIILNKGNNKITELRAILQRESQNS
jgi:hypothetical protein